MMIRDFKTRLFCQNAQLPRREVDSTDPLWVSRIDEFFRKRVFLPPPGDPQEYSASFEAIFPREEDRRSYIEEAIRKGTPSFAHRVLASLISTKRIPCVFTTNFDPLVETATTLTDQVLPADERAYLTVAALDSVDRAERCLRESAWPLIAKLHGDYQSVQLKNTSEELASQDEKMRVVLAGACQRFGLVVTGYSGRDESVMAVLTKALDQPGAFPAGIYWVTKAREDLLPAVQMFLAAASTAGISAFTVESQNFDELAADIVDLMTLPAGLEKHVFEARPTPILRQAPTLDKEARPFPVLRCSALPVMQLPTVARRLTLSSPASTVRVRELVRAANVWAVAASTGREVAAFGPDEGLLRALAPLGARLNGTIEVLPDVDSWALGLLYDALTRSLCRDRPLFPRMRRSGHFVLVAQGAANEDEDQARERRKRLNGLQQAYSSGLFGNVPGLGFPFNEGIRIRLEQCAQRWWCVFDPITYVETPRAERSDVQDEDVSTDMASAVFHKGDTAADWRRERWAQRYNSAWTKIIEAWSALLSDPPGAVLKAFDIPDEVGIDAVFNISGVTAWSRPAHDHHYFARRQS